MKEKTISLCMIAKNEANNIGRCLQSVYKFVDEIILVDTGSKDNTIEIARSFGVEVIEEGWKDDFSFHRNTSLANANGDWILFLDCDEELDTGYGEKLRKIIQQDSFEAYFVNISNKVEKFDISYPSIRIFKNRECNRFEGKIHEQINLPEVKEDGLKGVGWTDIKIIHHGYDRKYINMEAKIKRNMKILKSYSEDEKDGFYYFNLGTEYLRQGKNLKALENFKKALEQTRPTHIYGPVLVKKTITTLIALKRYRETIKYLKYYQKIYIDFTDLVFLEGICHLNCGFYSEAKSCFEKYLELGSAPINYPSEEKINRENAEKYIGFITPHVLNDNSGVNVCIIGQNEEKTISRCIKSVNEIADKVIYVDTGSDDASKSIAFQLGADVYDYEWNFNYGAVKNFAINKAEGDWILIIDADEALPDQSRKKIMEIINDTEVEAFRLKVYTFLDGSLTLDNSYVKGMVRLFRNDSQSNYKYIGNYDEDISSSILKAGGQISTVEIAITHLHNLADIEHVVRKKNIKLEVIDLNSHKNRIKEEYDLGVEYFYVQQFKTALEYFEKIYPGAYNYGLGNLYYYYSLSLINLNNLTEAIHILQEGKLLFPDFTDLYYLQAVVHYMQKEVDKAKGLFKQCVEMGDAPWDKYVINPGSGSFKAISSLASIYMNQGKYDRALELYLKLVKNSAAFEKGIEGLTRIGIRSNNEISPENLLQRYNLLDSYSLNIAARVFANSGIFTECIKYLNKSFNYVSNDNEEDAQNIQQTMDLLLDRFTGKLSNILPEDSYLKEIID